MVWVCFSFPTLFLFLISYFFCKIILKNWTSFFFLSSNSFYIPHHTVSQIHDLFYFNYCYICLCVFLNIKVPAVGLYDIICSYVLAGLIFWYWVINCALPWEDHFSHSQHPLFSIVLYARWGLMSFSSSN